MGNDILSVIRVDNSYTIKSNTGAVISQLQCYDYKIKGFDWVLLANIETDPNSRGQGFATKLINVACEDVARNLGKGIYLFVRAGNHAGVCLYEKLKFKAVRKYTLEDGEYIIMAKGGADIKQLINMEFI